MLNNRFGIAAGFVVACTLSMAVACGVNESPSASVETSTVPLTERFVDGNPYLSYDQVMTLRDAHELGGSNAETNGNHHTSYSYRYRLATDLDAYKSDHLDTNGEPLGKPAPGGSAYIVVQKRFPESTPIRIIREGRHGKVCLPDYSDCMLSSEYSVQVRLTNDGGPATGYRRISSGSPIDLEPLIFLVPEADSYKLEIQVLRKDGQPEVDWQLPIKKTLE
jgi:hypothetical protein